jgi:DNA-binding CsgD family transcriptional regulator
MGAAEFGVSETLMPTPDKLKRKLTDEQVTELINLHFVNGKSYEDLGELFGIHPRTARYHIDRFKKADVGRDEALAKTKTRLIHKGYRVIERGMDHRKDPYKAAAIAKQTVEGLDPDFKSGGEVRVTFEQRIVNLPDDWKERYVGGPAVVDPHGVEIARLTQGTREERRESIARSLAAMEDPVGKVIEGEARRIVLPESACVDENFTEESSQGDKSSG